MSTRRPPLFRLFPGSGQKIPWIDLKAGPTPVEKYSLPPYGREIWIKRDDLSGFDYGGNKIRKLEFLLGDAIAKGFTGVVTSGAYGTHHGLAVARYAALVGLKSTVLVVPPGSRKETSVIEKAGADVIDLTRFPAETSKGLYLGGLSLLGAGSDYWIPIGGSSPIGVLGFIDAAFEMMEQVETGEFPAPKHIVVPAGSGGTAAGLIVGSIITGLDYKVHAVTVVKPILCSGRHIVRLARKAASLIGADIGKKELAKNLVLETGYVGKGYTIPTPEAESALVRFREMGIELEMTYSAKAAAALENIPGSHNRGPVLFWNTYSGHD